MAVPAVWTQVYLLAPRPLEPTSIPTQTGGTPVPLFKNPKASCFWYDSLVDLRIGPMEGESITLRVKDEVSDNLGLLVLFLGWDRAISSLLKASFVA